MSDHFENRIREKLQEADFPFDQDAWTKMEQKLDAVAPTSTNKRRPFFTWWMGGMIVLLGVSAWLTIWYNGREQKIPDNSQVVISTPAADNNDVNKAAAKNESAASAENNNTQGNTTGNGSVNNVDNRRTTSSSPENKTNTNGEEDVDNVDNAARSGKTKLTQKQTTTNKLDKPDAKNNRTVAGENTIDNHADKSALSTGKAKKNNVSFAASGLPVKTKGLSTSNNENEGEANSGKTKTGKSDALSTSETENGILLPGNASIENINVVPELDLLNGATPKPVKIATSLSAKPTELNTISIVEKPAQKRGFALGFAVGPDYSVAPCFQFGNFGVSVGLQLQYAFNDRWSVSTGAFYAKKVYGATKADYEYNYNFQKVNADCDVLDVPLNLNYTLFQSGRHAWTATLGSSSYFMLKENYEMYYNSTNVRKYEYKNGSQHYFSMLNLGVGYQQQSGRHFMWGLQPYAKIPLSGVGHGNVKLTSFGVMLHVNLTEY